MKSNAEGEYFERQTNTKWEGISKVDFGLLKYLWDNQGVNTK